MNEVLLAPSPIDDRLAEQHVVEQIGFLQQEQLAAFTPAFAYEVGHDAVVPTVEVDVASVEARVRPPEARAAEMAAETWRSFSPFSAENAAMFGSEAGRLQAVETVRGIAGQAQVTGKYLNGQHKALGRKLASGEVTQDQHDEGVGEIAAVLAFTNPAHLRNVGEAQRASIERRKKAGQDVQFVDLTSRVTENGVELAGIDSVVATMTGARSQAELAGHGLELKKHAYGEDAFAKAAARHEKQQAEMHAAAAAKQQEIEVRHHIELFDEEARLLFERENAKKKADA